MQLEDMYINFIDLPESEMLSFVSSYRHRRAMDLQTNKTDISKVDISPEEEVVRKLLGITKKDFLVLKSMQQQDKQPEEEEETEELSEDE